MAMCPCDYGPPSEGETPPAPLDLAQRLSDQADYHAHRAEDEAPDIGLLREAAATVATMWDELTAARAEIARLTAKAQRLDDVLSERADDLSKEACDRCEECGPAVMCGYHSLLSALSGGTWTLPAIERHDNAKLRDMVRRPQASQPSLGDLQATIEGLEHVRAALDGDAGSLFVDRALDLLRALSTPQSPEPIS